jgi:hypothetical protein
MTTGGDVMTPLYPTLIPTLSHLPLLSLSYRHHHRAQYSSDPVDSTTRCLH